MCILSHGKQNSTFVVCMRVCRAHFISRTTNNIFVVCFYIGCTTKKRQKKKKKLFFTGRVGDCCPSLSPFSTQNAGGGACPLDPRTPSGRGRGTDDSKNLLSF
jgi:hypothetical protein